nr:zf-HC2 domain-containing protein [Micromonospora sp. DSM 115978]
MRDWLPAYAAGSLRGADRDRVRAHLADCPRCRADLAAWRQIAGAAAPGVAAPDAARVVRSALTRSAIEGPTGRMPRGHPTRRLRHLAALVVAEARLIRLAVPIASALVLALGVALVLFQTATVGDAGSSAGLVLALTAPIVAAAGVAGAHRSGPDPAAELVAATPTSERLLLLVRVALVFGYDLVIAVAASALLAAGSAETAGLNELVGAWLGPMALLSSLSLLIAVRFGPDLALGVAVGLWAVRVLADGVLVRHEWPARFIVETWSTNAPVLAVSAVLTVAAVAMVGRFGPAPGEPPGGWRATHPM